MSIYGRTVGHSQIAITVDTYADVTRLAAATFARWMTVSSSCTLCVIPGTLVPSVMTVLIG